MDELQELEFDEEEYEEPRPRTKGEWYWFLRPYAKDAFWVLVGLGFLSLLVALNVGWWGLVLKL